MKTLNAHAASFTTFTALGAAILAIPSASLAAPQSGAVAPGRPIRIVPATPISGAAPTSTIVEAVVIDEPDEAGMAVGGAAGSPMSGAVFQFDAAGAGQQPAGAQPPALSTEEVALLKATYDALDTPGREEMRAYYLDFGLDIDVALGIAAARSMEESRGQMVAMTLRDMDFTRSPEAVLSARAQLGFGQIPFPNAATADPMSVARWIHLHILAGEWQAFAAFLASRPAVESEPIYAAVLQSMNRGEIGLLPEEVLAIAEATPAEFKPWQAATLGRMLQQAAAKNSIVEMMASIRAGTRFFGVEDAARRRRTVEFLAAAGLLAEAYEFLTPLEEARAARDGTLLIVHARYLLDLAKKAGDGPEGETLRIDAFRILTETSLLEGEKTALRFEALRMAIAQMNDVPKAQVQPWLAEVFASAALGPAALEQLALSAAQIGNMQVPAEQRARAILNLKESVDVLLAREDVDSAVLRVPLRMVTTALVGEMERAVTEQGGQRFLGRDSQFLYRAIPSERWIKALEPSVALRARLASIAIATVADETDEALSLLDAAIAASPRDAARYADHFLSTWVLRLQPAVEYSEEMMMFFSFYRDAMPMAPLTRGRQRRNLDRLGGLIATLREVGVDAVSLPSVVRAFQACHARTEVYEKADIERILGAIDAMPPATAANLAATMAGSLNGDWRSREAQRSTGTKRSDSEIANLVDRGYGVAIELMESAVRRRPDAWNLAVLQAALAYDRLQFRQSLQTAQDPVQQNEYRRAAFAAFGDAARRYTDALARGETRDDPTVYRRWFGAAMGTAELNFLRPDDLPKEGTLQDDQIDLIRKSMLSLEPEARDRHLASFASDIVGAIQRSAPEVKPRLVRHALRVIGDHPAGASLRSMEELYRDLVKNEIRLRLALDGAGEVGVNKPFGLLLSLRFTHSVDRETGGFSKYLMNGVWSRVGNNYQPVNHRDELKKTIESAFGRSFMVETIAFFDPYMPARGVVEEGDTGWLEKPLAYVVLSRTDAAIDTVPAIVMEMQFTDQTGPVTLALPSNTPLLATGTASAPRRALDLEIEQLVDTRGAADGETVTLEVRMRGKGVLPELRDALAGLDTALPGYTILADGIVANPVNAVSSAEAPSSRFMPMFGGPSSSGPKEGYPEPDASGMYRLPLERSFTVTYTRGAGAIGREFALPTLVSGVEAKIANRYFAELDIMPVEGGTVPIHAAAWTPVRIALALLGAIGATALLGWFLRRKPADSAGSTRDWAPTRLTPLGVVTSLRRLEREHGARLEPARVESLRKEIAMLELKYFGPDAGESIEDELREVVERWR